MNRFTRMGARAAGTGDGRWCTRPLSAVTAWGCRSSAREERAAPEATRMPGREPDRLAGVDLPWNLVNLNQRGWRAPVRVRTGGLSMGRTRFRQFRDPVAAA